jgi:hypothetical protein
VQVPGSASTPALQVDDGLLSVVTWWKAGGSASELDATANTCAAKLGQNSEVDPAHRKVSHALLGCLSEFGWHAVLADKSGAVQIESIR